MLSYTGESDLTLESNDGSDRPNLILKNTSDGAAACGGLHFVKDKGAAGADGDDIGQIIFTSDDDAQAQTNFIEILGEVSEASDGEEGGKLSIKVASHDGELKDALVISDGSAEDEIIITQSKGVKFGTSICFQVQSVTGDSTIEIDWTLGNKANVVLEDGANTITFTDNPSGPCNVILKVKQNSGGDDTVSSWSASTGSIKWAGGTAPTLSKTGNDEDIVSLYFDGTDYYGVISHDFS